MRRIFTLGIFIVSFTSAAFAQNCATTQPNVAICNNVVEDFNGDNGGFIATAPAPGTGTFVYNGTTAFNRTLAGGNNQISSSVITSRTFTKSANQANNIQAGFRLTSVTNTEITAVTIEVLNASSNVVLATCLRTFNPTIEVPTTFCLGVTSPALTSGLNVILRFTITTRNTTGSGSSFVFDNFSLGDPANAALPVTFISFDAQKATAGTQLTWKVGTESNVKLYEVEKSVNGGAFSRVGFVSATGASSYSFTDAKPAEGTVLYRIKNVDYDGRSKYSSTINFKNGLTSITFKAFPLPARNLLTVQHTTASDKAQINIASTDGKTLRTIMLPVGATQTDVNLSGLKSGVYLLRFASGKGNVETMKILKQ
jgi:hypothetical protein